MGTSDRSPTTFDVRHTSRHAAVTTQKMCAWCGPLLVLACAVGLALFCRFVPPPSAQATPSAIAEIFRERTVAIRFGIMLVVLGAALLGPFVAVISVHMRRIEGPRPTLAYLQLVLGACFIMEIIFPMMAIQTAAFRPERADVVQQTLDDFGWLTFFGVASTAAVQMAIIGVVILQDDRATPVFPRWSGYMNLWVGLSFLPGSVMIFFKSGPLAWTGVFVFWIPFTAFFIWLIAMTWLLLRAVDHETAEELAQPDPAVRSSAFERELARLREQLEDVTSELSSLRDRLTTAN